jgi:cytochrome c oxidase assembly protein Cox11
MKTTDYSRDHIGRFAKDYALHAIVVSLVVSVISMAFAFVTLNYTINRESEIQAQVDLAKAYYYGATLKSKKDTVELQTAYTGQLHEMEDNIQAYTELYLCGKNKAECPTFTNR